MSNEHMKTDISDNYPYLDQLECQYFSVCNKYEPNRCGFTEKCQAYLIIEGDKKINMRDLFRKTIENYVPVGDLKMQIDLIRKEELDAGKEENQ